MQRAQSKVLPPTLSESGEASRFFDAGSQKIIAKVAPGFFYVTNQNEEITTVLGSCVAACIRDPVAGIGGINHFMLPMGDSARASAWGGQSGEVNRFGNFAMENLINAIIKHGGVKQRLEVKLFGGGSILNISSGVGDKNAAFAVQYLRDENIALSASDIGRDYARKIIYDPITGRARQKKLREIYNGYVVQQEKKLMSDLEIKPVAGSVELF